jgi:phosphoribosylformylglycinamidine synthase
MVYRIDVRTKPAPDASTNINSDPVGNAVRQQIAEFGTRTGPISTARIFLLETSADRQSVQRIADELLADPIVETAEVFGSAPRDAGKSRIEIHLKPGVMDPVAESTEMAIRDMGIEVREVRTGRAYLIEGTIDRAELQRIASRVLANGVIESVHFDAWIPEKFPAGRDEPFVLRNVHVRELTDEQLAKLSREGHLFLSLAEMKAIQNYFRGQHREPTDIELETLAQTWSEHCVHKTLKSPVDVEVKDSSGNIVDRRKYKNLIKETIFDSTMQLMKSDNGFCLSVFKDNAGVVVFDETDAVCFKVETHNHPSAIEPYGGSATGAGGVIRDILGTGLGAKPVANTDVFCVAFPDYKTALPKGVIHPKRVLQQVVAGVRDYGNRVGIPTVNGAVYFDNRYLGNPLVFCGCVGLIPRNRIEKSAEAGDAIVVMGGRTGRDGIHGATFSSAELTDTHADEFSHAVQIGNAITEKKMADVILAARDRGLFTGITDCGAGGLSSAIGEMGEKTGAVVHLDKVPLKYAGLRYDEIWISEAQERMVLSVPAQHVQELLARATAENVEATVIGHFGTENQELILNFKEKEVGRLSMNFLHDGIPMAPRKAVVTLPEAKVENATTVVTTIEEPTESTPARQIHSTFTVTNSVAKNFSSPETSFEQKLLAALAHPNIASKHWVIRQYDHEVQGGSVIKPLVGPLQTGPSDAAVIRPKLSSHRGVALGCGMSPAIEDPYEMALASIDEAIRNVVAVGADPDRIAILDNFCWPSVDDAVTMGTLVRACEACRDAALAYRIPFISGKDSLHNQFTNQETGEVLRIPRTLLISAIGVVEDIRKCVTMDFKQPGSPVYLIAAKDTKDLKSLAAMHRAMAALIAQGKIAAAHDVSDGGVAVAAAEMCIASGLGLTLDAWQMMTTNPFAEIPGRYVIELAEAGFAGRLAHHFDGLATVTRLGFVQSTPRLLIEDKFSNTGPKQLAIPDLTAAWRGTLDW